MPTQVICPKCGKTMVYDKDAGSYFCDRDQLHRRGPSKAEAARK